jgi:hypothetical protein
MGDVSETATTVCAEEIPARAAAVRGRRRANWRFRRARSTVIGSILGMIILNLALAAVAYFDPRVRDPMFEVPAHQFRERAAAADSSLTVAFLGSSRTGNGIRPVVAQELIAAETGRPCVAHNLHVPGGGPVTEFVHWRRLLERGPRPDVVVIEVCPPWLSMPDGQPVEAGALRGDRMARDETKFVQQYGFRSDVEGEWREANFNPWFGFRFQLLGRVRPRWLPPGVARHEPTAAEELGWRMPFFVSAPPLLHDEAIDKTREQFYRPMQLIRDDGPPAQALRDLVRDCRERGTIVAVWVTPEASEVRAWYSEESEARLQSLLASLRTFGACVVDGRTWLPDEAFVDGHHSARSWSDEYTRQVTRKAVLPALSR